MGTELLEIQPRELKFTFELKKQSSCSVKLVNKSNEYIAFKVKTTSPKRYCVRPNIGVILPRSTWDFTVTMQAQKIAPQDMQFKDKFLVQSTIVPYGSADEDIVPSFFSKENGRYVEEYKLRVVLVSPPHSPVSQPLNEALKQELANEAPAVRETPPLKDQPPFNGVENLPLPPVRDLLQVKEVEDLKLEISNFEAKLKETTYRFFFNPDLGHALQETQQPRSYGFELTHTKNSRNDAQADNTIMILKQEKSLAVQQMDKLQQEIVMLRRKCSDKVRVGFPFLFVVFMALAGAAFGYMLHQ